jgi:ABC-type antimicrobial peptide transport system permease subunit
MFDYEIDWWLTFVLTTSIISVVSFAFTSYYCCVDYKHRNDFNPIFIMFVFLSMIPLFNIVGVVIGLNQYITDYKKEKGRSQKAPLSLIKLCDAFINNKDYIYTSVDDNLKHNLRNNKIEITIYNDSIYFKNNLYKTNRYDTLLNQLKHTKDLNTIEQLYKSYIQTQNTGA